MFAYRTIKRFEETGSVKKRFNGGRKKTATNKNMVHKVKKRIERNPRQSCNKLARDLKISRFSMQKILKKELNLKPYKIQKVHELTDKQMKLRLTRAKELKRLAACGQLPNLVFSDEKIFTIEQYVNKQNDRVWLEERSMENLDTRLATRKHSPAQVMVWAAVTADGRSPLVFLQPGVKVNALNYQETVLESALKPWANKHFGKIIKAKGGYIEQ